MTDEERKMLIGLVSLVDHMLGGLSHGVGTEGWRDIRDEWHSQTAEIRERLRDEAKARVGNRTAHAPWCDCGKCEPTGT